nr:AbrB/MazE/SpoVT family DNA-binding domain-containing protein [uncultured Rhodopila sp.]
MSVVTIKGQVTIRKSVRDALSIGPGSFVDFIMDPDGRIVLRKAGVPNPAPHRFDRLRGKAGPGLGTGEVMALMRGQ